LITLVVLLLLVWGLIHVRWVQNWLVDRVANRLSKKLHTKVSVKHVNISPFNKMLIEGVLVEDLKKDTLLYAGTLSVNITDWFFVKDNITLHYAGLKDVVVNLNRTDSVWNHQFLIDYFSGPAPTDTSRPKKGGIDLDLKKVHIENLRFNQVDKWVGKDMMVSLKKLDVDAEKINFAGKQVFIKSIDIDQPLFTERNYAGRRPKKTGTPASTTVAITPPLPTAYRWNNGGLVVNIGNIHISNGTFNVEKQTERQPFTDRFDGQHLSFTGISGDLKNVQFNHDTLSTSIVLAAREKSGLDVKKLQADMKFTPVEMAFSNLNLLANNSQLTDYYAMRYENFNSDMADFIHKVKLEGNFKNSRLASDDIAIFAPALKSWKRVFDINGTASGTIDNLSAKKMLIKSGNTVVDGDIALKGLPDIKETFIDFKGNTLQTDYNDLVTIVPALKNVRQLQLQKLGTITYRGNFTGFINDFVTYGTLSSSLGNVVADINMKLPDGRPAVYSGSLSTGGFKLGQFLNNSQLGNIAFSGKVKGAGFTAKDLDAAFDGNFGEFEFNRYRYQNITVKGDFKNKLFSGTAGMNDPNLSFNDLTGTINFNGAAPQFNFDATLNRALLQPLGLAKDDFTLNGRFNLNFTGSNIDDFLGSAKIYSATLTHNGKPLSFDALSLNSAIENGRKKLTLQSNEANATITGRFKILQLPDAFKLLLNKYYPSYIKKPSRAVTDQDFDFEVRTKNVDEYIQLVDKKLKGFNDAVITGSLHLADNELNIAASVPEMSYDGTTFRDIQLTGLGTADTLKSTITVGTIGINDSLSFPATTLKLSSHNDLSDISLTTSASKTLNNAELNASVQTLTDGVKIHFFPSSFIINEKKWTLEKDGELTLRKSVLDASEIKFVQGQQQITIATQPSDVGNGTDIIARLSKVNIDDFAPYLTKQPRLEGIVDGTIVVTDPFERTKVEFTDTKIKDLRVDNQTVGDAELEGEYNIASGIARFKGLAKGDKNEFSFDGSFNSKDSTGNQLTTSLQAGRINLEMLQPYLGGIFSNIKGIGTGDIKIYGSKQHKYITGAMSITGGSLKVNYTQCRYNFNNETIIFNEDAIDFGNLELKDTLNNTARLSGVLYHNFFKDFSFDDIRFSSPRLLLLNTTKRDNSQFYGKVTGNALMTLNGPVNDMKMYISGGPSTLDKDSNHIYLPGGSSRESGAVDYIDFIQFGTLMESELKTKVGTSIVVDMELDANPFCKVDVILDEATGDIIKGQGNGKLRIRVGNKEPLSIRGRYDITKGSYEFNFQTFIKKPFTLSTGYINWTGDPYEAEINIDAQYKAENVDLANVSPNTKQRSDLIIVSHLTKTLKKPEISFDFVIPSNVEIQDKFVVERKLADYKKDPAEMNKQVSSLLIFNSFINNDQGFFGGGNPYNIAAGTIGQVVSSFLTNAFSKLLQKTLNDPNIITYFDITPSFDLRNSVTQLQAAAKFGLVKSYFNNRLIITLGGNLDYNNPYLLRAASSNNLLVTPDFSAEWLLTKDGKVRVVGFRRTSIDQVFGQRNRQGISLSYKKDFDNLRDLFRRDPDKRRKKKKAETTSTAAGQ
jgi:TamB, inner membrane protein subunit of TAM complex